MTQLESAQLLLGTDRQKIGAHLRGIRSQFDEAAIETYRAIDTEAKTIVDACSMLGLLAERRLILVVGIDAWKAADLSQVLDYLAAPSPDAVLVMTADKLVKTTKFFKQFTSWGAPWLLELAGPESPRQFVDWVQAAYAEAGVEVSPAVAKRHVEIVGASKDDPHLDLLTSDIARITTWAGGEPITRAIIDEMATPATSQKVWDLTDAWAARDRGKLLRLVEQLLAQGESPVRLGGILGRHIATVHQARRLLDRHSAADVNHLLIQDGVNRWAAGRFVEQASRIAMPVADAALARVTRLDAELKGMSALSSGHYGGPDGPKASEVVLERALCEL